MTHDIKRQLGEDGSLRVKAKRFERCGAENPRTKGLGVELCSPERSLIYCLPRAGFCKRNNWMTAFWDCAF